MDIKVLGTGCPKCKSLEELTRRVVEKAQLDATISKVEDIVDIMNYGIMSTPALVVDGVVVLKGYLPHEEDLTAMLMEHRTEAQS